MKNGKSKLSKDVRRIYRAHVPLIPVYETTEDGTHNGVLLGEKRQMPMKQWARAFAAEQVAEGRTDMGGPVARAHVREWLHSKVSLIGFFVAMTLLVACGPEEEPPLPQEYQIPYFPGEVYFIEPNHVPGWGVDYASLCDTTARALCNGSDGTQAGICFDGASDCQYAVLESCCMDSDGTDRCAFENAGFKVWVTGESGARDAFNACLAAADELTCDQRGLAFPDACLDFAPTPWTP